MDADLGAVANRAFSELGMALFIVGAYYLGKHSAKDAPEERRWFVREYARAFGIVAVFAFMMWGSYGTSWEGDGEWAMGREGGQRVTEFVPTDRERNEYGLRTLLVLGLPALVGVYQEANSTGRRMARLRIDAMRYSPKVQADTKDEA